MAKKAADLQNEFNKALQKLEDEEKNNQVQHHRPDQQRKTQDDWDKYHAEEERKYNKRMQK
jgi:hypothetical protein